jgi:hypothetical protein
MVSPDDFQNFPLEQRFGRFWLLVPSAARPQGE